MTEELLEFPCEFPIKVMGRDEPGFQEIVEALVRRHVDEKTELQVALRSSRNANFVSVTLKFEVQSRDQLDNIYRELTAHELILMVL
ncbi:MAG: DUF493 domain-containing protein [Gammaproteobacteria bacterium]